MLTLQLSVGSERKCGFLHGKGRNEPFVSDLL